MPQLQHSAVAVEDVRTAIDRFETLLGDRPFRSETVGDQSIRTYFLNADDATVELLEELSDDSPVKHFLERRGEGLKNTPRSVPHRTLVAAVDRDSLFSLEATPEVHRLLSNARLAVRPGSHRHLPDTALDVLVLLLRQHLAGK